MQQIKNNNRVGPSKDGPWKNHICYRPAKRPEGHNKFLKCGEDDPLKQVGMSKEDYDIYIKFLCRLHRAFKSMVVGTYEEPMLHFSSKNPVHRFRLYCMFRFMWEQPALVRSLLPHIKEGELNPIELELLAALLSTYPGHTHIQKCRGELPKEVFLYRRSYGTRSSSIQSVDRFFGLGGWGGANPRTKLETASDVREDIEHVFGYSFV